jgi:hypothetical protein
MNKTHPKIAEPRRNYVDEKSTKNTRLPMQLLIILRDDDRLTIDSAVTVGLTPSLSFVAAADSAIAPSV